MSNYGSLIRSIPVAVLGSIITSFILLIILLILNDPTKYLLYIFAALLIGIFILFSARLDYKITLTSSASVVRLVDYFLICCSTVVFVYSILSVQRTDFVFPLTIVISFLLPGWVLLRTLGVTDKGMHGFFLLPLSFVTSVGLTSLILMLVLPFKHDFAILLSGIYAIVSLFPLLRDNIQKFKEKTAPPSNNQNRYDLVDILVLLWITVFFILMLSNLYPQMANSPALDIARHFSQSKTLIQTPDIYSSEYLWFHSPLGVINEISGPSVELFQSGIACLSIILVFSFYLMAKTYLSGIDKHAHLISTLFFFVFSGFGWIYVVQQKFFSNIPYTIFDILNKANAVSYFDIGFGQGGWLWLWFRPITLGFTIFFILLYLMKRKELIRRNYIIITSLLLLTLIQVHFSEFFVFVALIFILALFNPKIKLRIFETAISVLVSVVAYALLIIAYQHFFYSEYQPSSFQFLFVSCFLACLICFIVRYNKRPSSNKIHVNSKLVSYVVLFIFSILLIYWFFNSDKYSLGDFAQIYQVPLEFYPVLLGVVGALSIFGTVLILKKYRDHPVAIFVVLLISSIIFGKIVTYINADFTFTNYFERRFIPFVYVGSSIVSSLFVSKILKQWNVESTWGIKNVVIVSLLSFLVLGGTLSTFFSVDYQLLALQDTSMNEDEAKLVSHLSGIDPYSELLTVTDHSKNLGTYGNLAYVIGLYSYQLWPSISPELPLHVFSALNSSTIIFLSNDDLQKISSDYENGYIASHILKLTPIIYQGPEGKIFQFPRISSPSNHSDMVLVLPEHQNDVYYAYDILSLGGYNYTTALESDINFLSKSKIIIAPNENIAMEMVNHKKEDGYKFKKLIMLNIGEDNKTAPSDVNESLTSSQTYDDYELIRLNMKPILQKLNAENADTPQIFLSLGHLLESTNVKLPVYETPKRSIHNLVTGGVAVFQNVTFLGNMILKSSSAIINVNSSSLVINVDGNESELKNVSKIIPVETDGVVIRSHGGFINGGMGFYSHVWLNQTSIHMNGRPSVILLTFADGSTKFVKGNEIEINLEHGNAMMRQPSVESNGEAKFENFYAYGELNNKFTVIGKTLRVDGRVSYNVSYSDVFTVVHNGFFNQTTSHSNPVFSFNGSNNLVKYLQHIYLPYR